MPHLDPEFRFKFLKNIGDILTTPHWHKEYEFLLITKGEANLGINDHQYHLTAGQIAFFNSGDIHYVVASPESERYVYQFDLNFFADVLIKDPNFDLAGILNQICQVSIEWPDTVIQRVRTILLGIAAEWDNQPVGYKFAVASQLYQLMVLIIRDFPRKAVTRNQLGNVKSQRVLETLNRVFQYVEQNYTRRIQLSEVAAVANFSEYYFARFFKRNVGKTFVEFLNDYRIDKAKWILINQDISITEVWLKVGFNSNKTFYRLFRDRTGLAPKKYRLAHRLDS
jgi:AraC-like DNA-binding protein